MTGRDMAAADLRLAYIALIAGGIIAALSFGVRSTFGLFLGPISLDFGYGREVFALSLALQNLVWGAVQPLTGAIADRHGPFRVIVAAGVIYAVGLVMIAMAATPWALHLSAGMMIGIGMSGTSFGIIFGAVGQLFPPDRRPWALGIVGAAGSLGQFAVTPIGQGLLSGLGWAGALVALAVVIAMVLPLALAFRDEAPGRRLAPGEIDQSLRQALAEALGYSSYWFLVVGFFVCGFQVTFIAVHLPAYAVDLGLSAETGAWALGVVGLFNVIGSYCAGVLGGRFSKKYLLSALYFARAVLILIFLSLPPTAVTVLAFAALMGLVWLSTVPLTSALVADMFGPRYMSTLFGIVFLSHQLGSFLGAWMGGLIFDLMGSYTPMWWIAMALGILSGVAHWPIREHQIHRPALA